MNYGLELKNLEKFKKKEERKYTRWNAKETVIRVATMYSEHNTIDYDNETG